jgi:hypothetical protein
VSREDLARFEARVADALTASDPAAAFDALATDAALPARLRGLAARADRDGVRLAGMLVAKLRFERIVRGSMRLARWFDGDPAGFTAAFRRYHHAVPPTASHPAGEAAALEAWLASESADR